MNIEHRSEVPAGSEAFFEEVQSVEGAAGAFEAAQAKAESFITDIDPDLTISVSSRRVELNNGTSYTGTVLLFEHKNDPDVRWSMDVGADPEYLDTDFESVVRNIYGAIRGEVLAERDEAGYEDVDFGDQEFAELQGRERPKTKDENSLIDQANIITNFARQRFNKPGIVVPHEAVHMIEKDKWPGKGSALFNEDLNAIAIREPEKNLILKKKLVHEMLHAKMSNLLPNPLKEALVESLTKKLMKRYQEDPLTRGELKDSEKLISAFGEERTEKGDALFTEDTLLAYVGEDGRLHSENFTYGRERNILKTLTEKMYEKSEGRFTSSEEAFDALVKADVTGNRDELGVIDECLGEGTLQKMYDAGDDVEALDSLVGSL